MLKRAFILVLAGAIGMAGSHDAEAAGDAVQPAVRTEPQTYVKTILSKPLAIDRIIKSMKGPFDVIQFTMNPADQAGELLWVTGFKAEIVEEDGKTPSNPEFLCQEATPPRT